MPSKKVKSKMSIPPYLTTMQVAQMLGKERSTIRKKASAGEYDGAYKPGGRRTSTFLIPSSLFPEDQVREYLVQEEKERGQSVN